MNNNIAAAGTNAADKDWWRGAVVYQIYPRSYQDSDNDGIGDLNGIVERLPYIASLGVDAIWISPFFTSPMKDFGYDVSNYRDVDPMFGTLADCDNLIKTAHCLGVKVIIDQVLSHSAAEHPWFAESRQDKTNPRHDWYVWADPKPDGTPPNNWLSVFGGSAWQWDARREQYYLHNFLVSQPDLNFHNPDVQDEMLDICRFWLDRGVDGFRLDTVNFYTADNQLRDNPPLAMELRNGSIAPSVNPYNHQNHIYSKNQPENLLFIERFRALLDEYPAATSVGEIGDAQFGLELLGEYTNGDNRLHMSYSFEFLSGEPLDAPRLQEVFTRLNEVAEDSWPCWALTNHDIKRHTTRWELDEQGRRMYVLLLMCVRGSVCLYQGEELGLPEADIAYDDLQDPYGFEFWPEFKGRDGCRTPMVWDVSKINAGFSDAKPWLPVPEAHLPLSVEGQEQENDSLLHYYRKAIEFRKQHPELVKGAQSALSVTGDVVSFTRSLDEAQMFCAFNIGQHNSSALLPEGDWNISDEGLGTSTVLNGREVALTANQVLIATKNIGVELI
ncbi:MAG: alpha-amylase family glycosyl hydrolase [Granulosicoccaceae bacterium]